MKNINETWKDILGYENLYKISNLGRIKSLKRKWVPKDKILKNSKGFNGYLEVGLSKGSPRKITNFRVHKLVITHFKGRIPKGYTVNHKDGNKLNNNVDNLEILTRGENTKHAWDTGLCKQYGEDSKLSKLTNLQAEKIREKYSKGNMTHHKLSVEYSVSRSTIGNIINNITYKNEI